ncbi:MAG TPA: DoxX family protein [Puia sp.]|nr:DoxX family protein [Puia sp.]
MGTLQNIQQWSITHHPRWLVILRVALGVCLLVKGIFFMMNAVLLEQYLSESGISNSSLNWLPLVITWAHLLGGFLLTIGLFTRIASLMQIPILVGAVIFMVSRQGMFGRGSELPFAFIILIMLFFFLIEGGGPISLDTYFKKNRNTRQEIW